MGEGESLLFMSFRLYLTTSENHTCIPIGLKDVCSQSVFLEFFLLLRTQNSCALVQVMGSTFPGCQG